MEDCIFRLTNEPEVFIREKTLNIITRQIYKKNLRGEELEKKRKLVLEEIEKQYEENIWYRMYDDFAFIKVKGKHLIIDMTNDVIIGMFHACCGIDQKNIERKR